MRDYGFYNMDCMDGMKEFPDGYFDLAIVDPVYGDVTAGGYMSGKYAGRRMSKHAVADEKAYHRSIWSQRKTDAAYFRELFRVSRNQIVWGGNYFAREIQRDSQCWVVWDKRHPEGIKFADCELAYTSFDRAARIFRYRWNGMIQENMKEREVRIHPTQKPVDLYKWLIHTFSGPGDVILDTHVGSGSSLIACHQTGHKYVGFEIDTEYYRKAKERIDQAERQSNIFDFIG